MSVITLCPMSILFNERLHHHYEHFSPQPRYINTEEVRTSSRYYTYKLRDYNNISSDYQYAVNDVRS